MWRKLESSIASNRSQAPLLSCLLLGCAGVDSLVLKLAASGDAMPEPRLAVGRGAQGRVTYTFPSFGCILEGAVLFLVDMSETFFWKFFIEGPTDAIRNFRFLQGHRRQTGDPGVHAVS